MITHLLRLLWHRKGANSPLIIEMFISFLVLFSLVVLCVFFWNNYRQPLGFSVNNVWIVTANAQQGHDDEWTPEVLQTCQLVQLSLKSFPEIEAVGGMLNPPYGFSSAIHIFVRNGKEIKWEVGEATDELKDVLGLNIVEGRWFDESDDASTYRRFYEGVLGYQEVFRHKRAVSGPAELSVFKVNERQYIEVSPTLQNPSDDKLIQIGYATADARKLRDYLGAHGVAVPSRVTKDSDGNYSFILKDPEGHSIEFVQYLEGSLQSRYSGKGISDRRISDHILHVGVHVKSPADQDKFSLLSKLAG